MKLEKDIAVFEGVMTPDECQMLIDYYSKMDEMNLSYKRLDLRDGVSHQKKDTAIFLLEENALRLSSGTGFLRFFLDRFWSCWSEYTDHYSVLQEVANQQIRMIKLQKTLPGEGYHQWHFESDNIDRAGRICAWGLYLNTVEQGGETEWLYQSVRVPAVQGTLTIWPAAFTHTHRGNPPLSGEKYLLTGWVEF